ncbi:UMF1 family MFS transporter [Diaminobutyricimonas aerilata]|uniref:UMF1 family MFS transporter n=1 Tax=Diaminobutyricimonas aerilata TaxID=1162967 RepID=A0A2M9CP21_9MICO|nr:MFS transporter [Diaminobutyricimonas aerilata]PJJ73639.1 UMF1 family MFS transporter [Diaminobutyricimonas aerilata]
MRDDQPAPRSVPVTANTGAVAAVGLDLQEGREIPRSQVFAWALWDWATQPFNTVILTFIFTALYLTTDVFLPPEVAALGEGDPVYEAGLADLASGFGWASFAAGLLIAIVAPVLGQRSDATGHRKRWLAVNTALVVVCMALLFFVEAEPAFFLLGVSLVALGSVFNEIAGVNYNAMLVQVSTRSTVGRVSGLGWGFGYLGGIVALVLVVIAYSFDWFGLPQDDGLPFRLVAVGCALWTTLFALPILFKVPELPAGRPERRVGFFASYGLLLRDVVALYRDSRPTFWFLLASAVFRDGLAGVFAFGAVIANQVFGFGFLEVVAFGIAANLVAGVSTIVSGRFDDRFGARAVILTALAGLVVAGTAVFLLRDGGDIVFWVGGLILCLFVGPAQAASRSFLARVTPAGREGEIFGLYATTGRAASFLSPGLWALFIGIFGATAFGILGIVLVTLVGFVLLLLVKEPAR